MTGINFAQGQVRSLIDRILRLKAEQDAIGQDIREVYKEAHANGFDKTILGLAVARLRKEEKNGAARVEETDSVLALYLEAYRGVATENALDSQLRLEHARAHTREIETPPVAHDAVTGEIADPGLPTPITPGDLIPDIPNFLDRRAGHRSAA